MFLKNLWDKILSIFGRKTSTTDKEYTENQNYMMIYQDTNGINFNAIFSKKLSNYCSNKSEIDVIGENKRAEFIDKKVQEIWNNRKKIFARMFGTGGIYVLPYFQKGELQFNYIPQFRISINEMIGEKIINMTVLSDIYTQKNGFTTNIYYRWTDYKIENNNQVIEQRYTDENGTIIAKPEIWQDIIDYMIIPNVEKVIGGYFKSPIDNRQNIDNYGVPITYGCDKTISEIKDTLKQIQREYKLKQTFVGMDYTLFKKDSDGNDVLPNNGLFKKFDMEDENYFIYDPAFRPYLERLEELYRRLEKEIGTSGGILSQVQTSNATATEIKKAMYDTYTIVDDARNNFEKAMQDLIDGIEIITNYYSISPMGNYQISYDWSDTLVEDEDSKFNRLIIASDKQIIKKAEVREYLHPEETLEESQKIIDEIKAENPSIEDLLGTKENDNKNDEE